MFLNAKNPSMDYKNGEFSAIEKSENLIVY